MTKRDRIVAPGAFSLWGIVVLVSFGLLLVAAGAAAEQPGPSPSPLFQQSLQKSLEKFQERDLGGGSPKSLGAVQPAIRSEGLLRAVSEHGVEPILGESLNKPAGAICQLQRDANSGAGYFPFFFATDKIAVFYDPTDAVYGCGVANPYPLEIFEIWLSMYTDPAGGSVWPVAVRLSIL